MNFDEKTGRILIEGLHNARDLGGMTAKDGKVTAYHRLIRSDAAGMFARESESSQMDIVLDMPRSGRLTARIASSQSGKCKLALSGFLRAIPVGNVGTKAVVVLSLTPLKIRQMTFPVQKVKFDHTWVFMTPMMMNDMGAWESLQGGLNLLKPTMR
jgi:hypothetical protein